MNCISQRIAELHKLTKARNMKIWNSGTNIGLSSNVGVFFVAIALVDAIFILPGARESQSPILYVCIFGGLFVAIPATLGIAVVTQNRKR